MRKERQQTQTKIGEVHRERNKQESKTCTNLHVLVFHLVFRFAIVVKSNTHAHSL